MKNNKLILSFLFIPIFTYGCFYDIDENISKKVNEAKMPFSYEIFEESRQEILNQDFPWESQAILYYNIHKKDSLWQMWYMGVGRKVYNDLYGAFCYAYSFDGEHWIKELPYTLYVNDSSNILQSPEISPIIEQYVFYDEKIDEYRMIGASTYTNQTSTFIWSSKDGIKWSNKTLLYQTYYDTQFSVLIKDDLYYIYQRMMKGDQRTIGRSVIDRNLNIIEHPKLMLISTEKEFPHIYNNAASKVKNLTILFPTLYNDETDDIKMTIGYEQNNELYLSDANITNSLYFGENIEWGIVSPGLIPTDELDTYWMFYYGSSHSHNVVRKSENTVMKYFRIKIRITLKS